MVNLDECQVVLFESQKKFEYEIESYSILFKVEVSETVTDHGIVSTASVDRGCHVQAILLVLCPVCYSNCPSFEKGE